MGKKMMNIWFKHQTELLPIPFQKALEKTAFRDIIEGTHFTGSLWHTTTQASGKVLRRVSK